jgi:hypothetical protein
MGKRSRLTVMGKGVRRGEIPLAECSYARRFIYPLKGGRARVLEGGRARVFLRHGERESLLRRRAI